MKQALFFYCVLLLLATGCQTEKTAFQFRPALASPAQKICVDAPLVLAEPIVAIAPAVHPVLAPSVVAQRHTPIRPRLVEQLASVSLKSASAATSYSKAATSAKRHRPQKPQLEHTAAFILGVALVVGGVVGGILIGGWLGLGVGALVVLLGYYFLGVGIGGKHAWLEVFQEFFNM